MDILEIFVSTMGALLVASLILHLDRRFTAINEFNSGIIGMETEIQITARRLVDLEDYVKEELKNLDVNRAKGKHTIAPPVRLLQNSYDYCRIHGILFELPVDIQNAINRVYQISDFINEFIRRDFELFIQSPNVSVDKVFSNKKLGDEGLLKLIEEHKNSRRDINLKQYMKKLF